MEEFTEHSDVATANAILLSQKKQQLFCFACYIGVNNFYSHIIMPRHIVFLDRFKLAFEDRDKKLYCKKCRFNIEWESTKSHLECDKTTPWYTASKPISRTFFQNHTIRLTNSYYCFLCEKSLDYWDTAHLHFQEFGHMSLRSINAPDHWPENNYTVLITQGFVPGPDGTVDCKVCGKNYLTTEEMREHKVTIEHKANRVTFIANYENYKVKQSFSNKGSQSTSLDTLEESISKLVKAGPLNQDQNPEKIRVPNSGNMTFNFSQQEIPVEEIPKSKKSKKKARKVLQSLELRETNCANNLSPKLHENHTITSQHENHTINFIVSGADDLCKMAMAIARNDKQNKRKMFQQTKKEPLPYCLICFTELPGYHAVQEHLQGKRHEAARKKYGCDNIILIDGECYFCSFCERTFSGFGHVYRHITSSSHLSFVESAQENRESQCNLNRIANSIETEEAEASNKSMACWFIVKQNARRSWCQICDETQLVIATKDITDHIASQRHNIALKRYGCDNIVLNANGSYSCRCCNCDIYDIDGVYLHIKEKRHMSFGHVYRHNTSSSHLSFVESAQENQASQYNLNKIANSMETEEAEALNESMACLYVVKQNAKRSWCQICDETQLAVATKNIANHIASQRHKIALQRYGCDNIVLNANGSYSCRCCNCDVYDIGGVYLHIKEKRHMSSLIKVCRRQEERREKRKIETLSEDEPCNGFISKSNRSGLSNAFELSQRNMISNFTLEPNNAHCSRFPEGSEPPQQNSLHRSMDRQNSGDSGYNRLDDVYEKRSDDRPEDKGMENQTPFDINSILDRIDVAKQPELRMMMSSMSAELARFLATCSTKEAKRADESQRRVERKRNPELVGEAKKFSCTVCNAKMEDRTQLHVHMASHYTDEFARVKRSRGNETIGNLANNRRVEVGNGSHEAQQVEQSLLEQLELGEEIANCVDNGLVDVSSHLEDHDPEIMEIQTAETPEGSPREKNSQKRANLKKVAQLLDFDHDYIYDLVGKLEDVELGIMLGLVVDSSKIYCLICRRVFTYTLDKYYEHLYSVDHCNYLEEMERDNALFKDVNNQFSDMDLAKEYMQEVSDDTVRCIICDDEVANNDRALEAHIYHEIHERKCEETRAIARRCFERIAPRMHCDWYDVQKYWCVCCEMKTDSEVDFVKHLNNRKHERAMSRPENVGKKKIFDFCANCAVLWYGYRCTYSYHSTIDSHKWLERDGHYLLTELPEHAKRLLASMQQFIDHRIKFLNEIQTSERAREKHLLQDLVRVARIRFPRSKAYLYGSRVSGLGSSDSDMDIFLDCRDEYNGNSSNLTDMLFFMNGVHRSLSKESQSWDVEELLTGCRSPIIRVCHRATGINCDISFENGLAVENTQLIKTYNKIFPMCRRMTLFLKQWLLYCGLLGSRQITSYALYWYVIFYLQKESILPSVAMLIALKRRSCRVAGWEVGVTHDFEYSREFSNYTLKEFLIRFFTFYAEFDFRYDVACPLLGEVVKKRSFLDIRCLPKEMEPYVDYMRGRGDPEPFRIDSPMCIQDPFDLQHNLTKAVNKVYLNRFRKCCAKSLDILWSS